MNTVNPIFLISQGIVPGASVRERVFVVPLLVKKLQDASPVQRQLGAIGIFYSKLTTVCAAWTSRTPARRRGCLAPQTARAASRLLPAVDMALNLEAMDLDRVLLHDALLRRGVRDLLRCRCAAQAAAP